MTRLEMLKTLCKSRGISINKLEQELGFSQGSLAKIDTSVPKADKLYAIAQYFGIPMEDFFSDEPVHIRYEQVVPKSRIDEMLFEVAAGNGRLNDGLPTETISETSDSDSAWCKVCGDSMYPVLQDGDCVKVESTADVLPTDLTAIRIDGESCTIKYVEIVDNGIWVRAQNKAVFEDRFYSTREVISLPIAIIGKVVELKRRF